MRALILCDMSREHWLSPDAKTLRLSQVLTELKYSVLILGKEACDPKRVEQLETQTLVRNGWKAEYGEQAFGWLKRQAGPDAQIFLTQPWHHDCLRGLTRGGYYRESAVVETWIDYPQASAHFRVYPTRFHRNLAAGMALHGGFRPEWAVARPYVPRQAEETLSIHQVKPSNALSLAFLEFLARGVPVVAPDWGVWQELIEPGRAGALYSDPARVDEAVVRAAQIAGTTVLDYAEQAFSKRRAAVELAPFLEMIRHG